VEIDDDSMSLFLHSGDLITFDARFDVEEDNEDNISFRHEKKHLWLITDIHEIIHRASCFIDSKDMFIRPNVIIRYDSDIDWNLFSENSSSDSSESEIILVDDEEGGDLDTWRNKKENGIIVDFDQF
jgi:hypothetical protein